MQLAHGGAVVPGRSMAFMNDLLPFSFVLLVVGTFLFAGLVKGAIGLSLPTVAMGLLGPPGVWG